MTRLSGTDDIVSEIEATALILGVIQGGEVSSHTALPEPLRAKITDTLRPLDPGAGVGMVAVLPIPEAKADRVVVVGLGEGLDDDLRNAAGVASRECGKRPGKVVVALPALTESAVQAVAEGVVLGSYTFDRYRTPTEEKTPTETEWVIAGASASTLERARIVIDAVVTARDHINTPPSDLYPESFHTLAEQAAQEAGVTVEAWDQARLEQEGFGGLTAVGKGSLRSPRLVRLGWTPPTATETVALVGKGITFDTGGISIKSNDAMLTMKSDMAGAAVVLGVVVAAARLELPIAVTGWLCLAENMPSGSALRPSDVIRVYGGTSVEVTNTDAEGRLVLADGIVRAREENPDILIDVATLTGAQGLALGERTSGVMGTPMVREAVVTAANAVGEPMWPMPLPDYLRESLDSKVADLKNLASNPKGAMLVAGVFLREFVGNTPWAHIDFARPAFNDGAPYGCIPSGGTGAVVRTLVRFLETRCSF